VSATANAAVWVRAGALYVPIVVSLLAGLARRPGRRVLAGCLLSWLWAMTSLVALARLNELAGWWSFAGGDALFCGMPLELYIGWALLWGMVPQMVFRRLELVWVAVVMAGFDLIAMPVCGAVVLLGPSWLVGEAVAVVIVLVPALCVARWTLEDTHLRLRSAFQVAISGMLFLLLVPEVAFALRPGRGWEPLLLATSFRRQLELQMICVLALPGVAAVMEFAERGLGTPIPYDPPKRLVTSGVYRYCANPMQVSCGLVMLAWAGVLHNGWLVLAAVVSAIYSAGIAAWDEGADLEQRFGMEWRAYRAVVRNWRVRWRPYHAGPQARVYIARTCGPCTTVRRWLERREPLGLVIVDAETLPAGSIRRMRYDAGDGSAPVEGVRAMGRVLEHINFGWAMCGAAMRLPGVWQLAQLVLDASGLGPRTLTPDASCGVDFRS
jgi:protein-S-isoprenylcysteine O-methyltransferase Ste14